MKNSFKIFIQYIFNIKGLMTELEESFKKFLKLKNLAIVSLFIASIVLIKFPTPKNGYIALIFFIISLILYSKAIYRAGDHLEWYRKKKGIVSTKQIKKINEEKISKIKEGILNSLY